MDVDSAKFQWGERAGLFDFSESGIEAVHVRSKQLLKSGTSQGFEDDLG